MKKKFALVVIVVCSSIATMACDICGSGAGGGYMGLLPGFRKKFISMRYLQNSLQSHLAPGGSSTYLTSKEAFRIAELWGAVNIGEKFRVAAFVPFNFLKRSNGTGDYSHSGIGDVSVLGYCQLMNRSSTTKADKLFMQSLWIGAGIKLPSGKYNPDEKNVLESSQNTFQLGTGSVDFSLNAMYDIRLQDAGINVNAGYKINSENKYEYKYGNKFTTNVLAYYKISAGKSISISPNAGVLYETSAKDQRSKDIKVWETGGHSLAGTLGLEFSFGAIGVGMNYQKPIEQDLGEGKIKAKDRGMLYVSFSF
ncbi:MAG TPA: transporter [Chitinophagaceae bacterium]|jgi:hypothetical protein|nr:transporter [Chitinophagaceae bacterium]